jgi:aminoglycoside phosphotransferase (APT) family kinase protein
MDQIGSGRSAAVFRTDRNTALKLYDDRVPETQIHREADMAAKVASVSLLAPAFYGLVKHQERLGVEMELIEGVSGSDALKHRFWQGRTLIRQLADVHRQIHRQEIQGLMGPSSRFLQPIQSMPGLDNRVKDDLTGLIARSHSLRLCHGDFHPENILITPNGMIRVIDWMDAYQGDPLSDVARTHYLLRFGISPHESPLMNRLLNGIRPWMSSSYVKAYFMGPPPDPVLWQGWQLVIGLQRMEEGIKEEMPMLLKWIDILFMARYRRTGLLNPHQD